MDSPYRIVNEKDDIVNTRIYSLEKNHEIGWTCVKGLICAVVTLFVIDFGVMVNSVVKEERETMTCRDTVKIISVDAPISGDKNPQLQCDHAKHVVNYNQEERRIILICRCQ